ncbi:MAG: DUF296 domain-containing protein, partial [Proteobacteria bacterium]|nr:DUF296 domain-containing protein [Pseudomonadota bacterium]
ITPMEHVLGDVREISGVCNIFPDKDNRPVLHMHIACGREESTVTGCVRRSVNVWHLLAVVTFELVDSSACRMFDELLGFALIVP